MDQQTEGLLRAILARVSVHAIHFYIDVEVAPHHPLRPVFDQMLATSRLDEIHAVCHEQLGEFDKAKTLRDFMAKQDSGTALRQSPSVIDFDEDEEDDLDTPTEKRYVLLEIFEDDDANDTTFDSYEDALSEEDMLKMLAAKLGYTVVKQTEDRTAGIERAMQLAHQWAWACYTKALDKGGDIDGTKAALLTFLDQEWKS